MSNNSIETVEIQSNAESVLRIVAKVILYVGILAAVICLFNVC